MAVGRSLGVRGFLLATGAALLVWFISVAWVEAATQAVPDSQPDYTSAILVDGDTGAILDGENIDQPVIPASVVKVMTVLVTMEMVERGQASPDEPVTVSAHASKIGGSQVYLAQGEVFPLDELVKAVLIGSANDASEAIAEHLGGTEANFVDLMNARARELGMTGTHFVNAHGLPTENGSPENQTTARDIVIAARELLRYPEALRWSSTRESSFRDGTFQLINTNKLLGRFDGLTGIKTGYTQEAGFCLVASATRGDLTFIAAVFGGRTSDIRFQKVKELLGKGFLNYQKVTVVQKGAVLDPAAQVKDGKQKTVPALAGEELKVLLNRTAQPQWEVRSLASEPVVAPITEGQKIGEFEVLLDGESRGVVSSVAGAAVPRANLFDKLLQIFFD